MIRLLSLRVGKIAPLGPQQVSSGIGKRAIGGSIFLSKTGFQGDMQADTRHHGGLEKAVHHYDYDHYQVWRNELGDLDVLQEPGAFGENIATQGINERNICVGDVFSLGKAVVQVSQGRQPCFKLNLRFQTKNMALLVQNSGRTGWYYRVLQEGSVDADDTLSRIDRLCENWSIYRLWHILYVDRYNWSALEEIAELEVLAQSWRDLAVKRLRNRAVEDWSKRLNGPQTGSTEGGA
ncbi:MOSC domain-containing protein [Bartonella sp. LJL80]